MRAYNQTSLISTLIAAFGLSAGAQVSVPYTNDFDSSVADFTETTGSGASWSLDTGNSEYDNTATGSGSAIASSSVVSTPDLSGTDFTLSSTLTLNSASIAGGSDATFGFAAYGNNADLSGSYFLADVNEHGDMRIFEISPTSSLTSGSFAGGALATGTTYDLTLDGSFDGGGDLTLALTVDDGTDSTTITSSPISNPFDGDHFGFRNRLGDPNGSYDASLDEFSVIPEPSSYAALIGIAVFGFGAMGRSRRR